MNTMKKTKRKDIKNSVSGITLIALVITIVVLIILAGVAISLTLNENGIFNRAREGRNNYLNAQDQEQEMINTIDSRITEYINSESSSGGSSTPTATLLDVQKDDMFTKTTNSTKSTSL